MSELLVSHSQIGAWNKCEMRWYFQYELGYTPKKKSEALRTGSLVHSFLERHYRNELEGQPQSPVAVHQAFLKEYRPENTEDLEAFKNAASVTKRYITEYAPVEDSGWEVVKVEEHAEHTFLTPNGNPYTVQMYLDVLMHHIQSGTLWLWDHKTHRSRPWTPIQIMMDSQLPTYVMILREKGFDVHGMVYNLINVYPYKNPPPLEKLFARERTYRTDAEIENIVEEVGNAVDEIYQRRETPRRSFSKDCSYCPFQEPCLMGMKGMDVEVFLEDGFEKNRHHEDNTQEEEDGY